MIAVLPALLMPLSHAKGDDINLVLVVSFFFIAVLIAILFKYGLYMRRTPLVRIDGTSLTFFGHTQSQQRTFQRHVISSISLSRRPSFWRLSFRFSVVADGETVDLWIPHSSGGSVSALTRALREEFPGKYEAVIG